MSLAPKLRVAAIDLLRGLVILLMTIDHASGALNAGRIMSDSGAHYHHELLPLGQFLTRWVTHLCAPSYVFLAGASLAMSVEVRMQRGASPGSIDRHIVARGLFLAALDPLWMTLGFFGGWSHVLFQVLYAIGMSLVAMALLRRLPSRAMIAFALASLVVVDLVTGYEITHGNAQSPAFVVAAFLSGGAEGRADFAYPILPWLAIMMLGWVFGRRLAREPEWRPERMLLTTGVASLATFLVLRGIDGFGNAGLHRDDGSLVQWLHVSKYPPSVTYVALELGVMALLLGGFFALDREGIERAWTRVLRTFGETSLFYYLLHVHVLIVVAHFLHIHRSLDLRVTYVGSAAIATALYFAARQYRSYKRAHDNLITRWV
jgi:uncharacterized membrane protein